MKFALLLLLPAGVAMATPIVFTFSGTATGTFGVTAFTSVPYTVTSFADTSAVTFAAGTYEVQPVLSTISILGFSVATFLGPTSWSDPQGSGDIIFGAGGASVLGITVIGQGLETYNLQSSFGPIFAPIDFETDIFHNFENIPTTQGLVTVSSVVDETFTAMTPTPEPGSLLLAGLGLTGLLALRKGRRRV